MSTWTKQKTDTKSKECKVMPRQQTCKETKLQARCTVETGFAEGWHRLYLEERQDLDRQAQRLRALHTCPARVLSFSPDVV